MNYNYTAQLLKNNWTMKHIRIFNIKLFCELINIQL